MVPSTQVQKDWKTDHENQNQTFQLAEWSMQWNQAELSNHEVIVLRKLAVNETSNDGD